MKRHILWGLIAPVAFSLLPACALGEMPPAPRVAMLWASIRGDRSVQAIAKHDLVMMSPAGFGLKYDASPPAKASGFTAQSIEAAKGKIAEIRKVNPRVVILCDLMFYEWPDAWLPEDHPWWLRKDGKRVQFWPGTHRMDWTNAEYRALVVRWTKAVEEVGFDGVFYDNLREEPEPWVELLKGVRQVTGEKFLILANVGYSVGRHDFAAPYLNGIMYESGWSHRRVQWDETIKKMRHTESLLRRPTISVIEQFEETRDHAGWPGDEKRGQKPPEDAAARRWSLCFSLIVGDFYYLFSDNTSHRHDWHAEYDVELGRPVEEGKRLSSHVWERRYEKGRVVVNLPGAGSAHSVELGREATDQFSGSASRRFEVRPGEGLILRGGPD